MRGAFFICLLALSTPAWADDALSPAEVGVRVEKPAGDGVHYQQGSGVYLGDGLVLTAAHVIKLDPAHNKVIVLIDGIRTDGEVVFDGAQKDNTDLAMIKLVMGELLPKRLKQPQVPVCPGNSPPNQPVVVAAMGAVSDAATIGSPVSSIGEGGNWTNLLSTGYHQGNSGGGVFDPSHGCLWGIVIAERAGTLPDGRYVDLTAFMPTKQIDTFLDDFAKQAQAH